MSGCLVVDSVMTADGEVVQLGPVDKDGHRVPMDTRELYDEDGKCLTVRCFLYFPFTSWLAFGESYTSRLIHNDLGFGYAVCPRCYEAEFREMGESCDL